MAKKKAAEAVATGATEQKTITFSKSNILKMKRYSGRRDLLNTLLEDGKYYTLAEVDNIINEFLER